MAQKAFSQNTDYRSSRITLIGAERGEKITLERQLKTARYRTRHYQLTSMHSTVAEEIQCLAEKCSARNRLPEFHAEASQAGHRLKQEAVNQKLRLPTT